MAIFGIVCDIEGTTSSISFVHKVLFPLSLEKLDSFLQVHGEEQEVLSTLQVLWHKLNGENPPPENLAKALAPVLKNYILSDVKDTTLKWVQGKIWKEAFESGAVKGHVYPEVAEVLRRWKKAGIKLYVYSSGSVEAQQLLFRYSEAGDLAVLFDGFFDTNVGGKKESTSYTAIAATVNLAPEQLLFLSDVAEELQAASKAGFATCLLLREGASAPLGYQGPCATDFFEVSRQFVE